MQPREQSSQQESMNISNKLAWWLHLSFFLECQNKMQAASSPHVVPKNLKYMYLSSRKNLKINFKK